MKLSKDPITATTLAHDRHDAEMVYFLYEEIVEELPFEEGEWLKGLSFPVELYLIFPGKRAMGKFLRQLATAMTTVDILAHY